MDLELLKPTYTNEELSKIKEYNSAYDLLADVSRYLLGYKKVKNCFNTYGGTEHASDKYWGYYISRGVGVLLIAIKRLNVKSFMDLGCGAGILMKFLQHSAVLKVAGIERDKELYKIANVLWVNPINKDLLDITPDDIKKYQLLYMWDPIKDYDLSVEFIKKLLSIISKDQILCCYPGGFNRIISDQRMTIEQEFGAFTFFKLKQ